MKTRLFIIIAVVFFASLATVAYLRSGLLDLPGVPGEITPRQAGLENLEQMKQMDEAIAAGKAKSGGLGADVENVEDASSLAVTAMQAGNGERGIELLQDAVRRQPTDLVCGNVLRMEILKLQREWLKQEAEKGVIALRFPGYLDGQPARFFREQLQSSPPREVKMQLALALVDQMLLFPALEIKAPASVEAVEILTDILKNDPYYVPALYARGLNYLYRPFNLVWPERIAAAPDAASQDLALCVAVGNKIGAGSNTLKAELSLALGDAYAKEGKLSKARSWWQLANNLAHNEKLRQRVFLRLSWKDSEVFAKLEQTLQQQMEDLNNPLSDLRFMWQ